ncbi:MAG: universal stress protein [Cellulosilyticaceae bacterium]
MSISTILLPITNSLDTEALNYTKELALSNNANLIVLYITSPLTFTSCYSYPSILYSVANLNMESINIAHQCLTQKIDSLLTDCPHEVICLIGPHMDTIINVARQKNVDLIVVPGAKEHSLDKLIHHTNKDKLSKKTKIPVMIYDGKKEA